MITAVVLRTAVDVSFFVKIKGQYWGLALSPHSLLLSSAHASLTQRAQTNTTFALHKSNIQYFVSRSVTEIFYYIIVKHTNNAFINFPSMSSVRDTV